MPAIRNQFGQLLGTTQERPDGVLLFDLQGKLRGAWNSRDNRVRDAQGRLVGEGEELLVTLLLSGRPG